MSDILTGHVLDRLAEMEPESVSCVVTSPPYWSLRKYDAEDVTWGGDAGCEHSFGAPQLVDGHQHWDGFEWQTGGQPTKKEGAEKLSQGATCARCGAWRGQYGLEPTPELYVEHSLAVLRGIRRVLRPDGVVWWNIGDGYAGSGQGRGSDHGKASFTDDDLPAFRPGSGRADGIVDERGQRNRDGIGTVPGLKPKDLVLMPFRIALAAQADGWWVRSVVIWAKPNAMPESVTDRPTTAHEYVLMLTKSARYYYDQEAVRQQTVSLDPDHISYRPNSAEIAKNGRKEFHDGKNEVSARSYNPAGRNLRSVWTFPTAQTPEAHFATFPPELPRRCIEASCPKAICAKCGEARVRVVEDTAETVRSASETLYPDGSTGNRISTYRQGNRAAYGQDTRPPPQTVGWTSCDCAEPEYQPGLVLDPFAGLGTTGVVALQLGRRFVGIELSEKYAELARTKLATWWRQTKIVEPDVPDGQAALL